MTLIWILAGFLGWNFLGCAVMATIDKDGRYLTWYKECPMRGLAQLTFWATWPILLVVHLRGQSRSASNQSH